MNEHVWADARRLLRLRRLREDAAHAELARCRRAHAARAAAVERRQAQIVRLRDERIALLGWLSGAGAAVLPRVAACAGARGAALAEALERAEVELIDEQAALRAAAEALDAARAGWVRAQARRQGVEQCADAARRAGLHEREQRAEREIESSRLRMGV